MLEVYDPSVGCLCWRWTSGPWRYVRKVMTLQLAATMPLVFNVCCSELAGATPDAELTARANRLARESMLIDTHMDVPYQLQKKSRDISVRNEEGHFDYVRAREGGLDAVFMAVYVPPEREEKGDAREFADKTIDLVEDVVDKHPDKFVLACSATEVREQFGGDRITIVLGMENGAPVEGSLENLKHFYDRGIRYITLCHSKNNHICDSSFDWEPKWHGLSPFGKELVAEMNRLGMIVDVSHVCDETFYQVLELSKTPVVATHSSCRHFTPGWHRNMSDDMIRRLADKGGVIHINFGSMFVDAEINSRSRKLREEIHRHVEANNLQGEEREQYIEQQWESFPLGRADVTDVARHIEHVIKLVGVEHVGLGSDFDGVTSVPEGLDDVSCYPNLIRELLKAKHSEQDIKGVCAENFLRVWTQVERTAAAHRTN